ncbi:MAG: hypothetical protein JKX72_02250, partial [Robiginitomaculum sp.]|nr:hypothetical protein [Robiginitomaculum sp.]
MDNNNNAYFAQTHEVKNQPPALENYNVYQQDIALQEAVGREDAAWANDDLLNFGQAAGSSKIIELGAQANENKP